MCGTAPKNGSGSGVREILKSGTLPIFMRMSQMFTLTSRRSKNASSDEEILTETSGKYEEKEYGKSVADSGQGTKVVTKEISLPMTEKAERLMGVKRQEIYVRRDIDVESMSSRDNRALEDERWEGSRERW